MTAAWCLTHAAKPFLILLLRKLVRSKEFWTKGLRAAIDPSRVDAMASDWSDVELSWLWTLNFFISGSAVLVYGWIASRVSLNRLVPGVYLFFAVSFGLFYIATQSLDNHQLIDKSFYIWVSFFALFHVSVFWSFMSDLYNSAQSKRLFGLFGAGASIGAVSGPLIPVFLGTQIGVYNLLLIAALMLLLILQVLCKALVSYLLCCI